MSAWVIEYTDQFGAWWTTLSVEEQRALTAAVELLERDGPALGRPLADTITASRHANMKELRPPATSLRVLFAFDPRRSCSSGATSRANGSGGTGSSSPWLTAFTTSTWPSWPTKETRDEWPHALPRARRAGYVDARGPAACR